MIDKAKRTTLKILSIAAGSAATVGSAMASGISAAIPSGVNSADDGNGVNDNALAEIKVGTRVSALHNDIEIVLTNTGSERTIITHMTPAATRVPRGEFDFRSLLKHGPVALKAGESVTVPLTRKPVNLMATGVTGGAVPLSASLGKTISIVTDNSAFARVDIAGNMLAA